MDGYQSSDQPYICSQSLTMTHPIAVPPWSPTVVVGQGRIRTGIQQATRTAQATSEPGASGTGARNFHHIISW